MNTKVSLNLCILARFGLKRIQPFSVMTGVYDAMNRLVACSADAAIARRQLPWISR